MGNKGAAVSRFSSLVFFSALCLSFRPPGRATPYRLFFALHFGTKSGLSLPLASVSVFSRGSADTVSCALWLLSITAKSDGEHHTGDETTPLRSPQVGPRATFDPTGIPPNAPVATVTRVRPCVRSLCFSLTTVRNGRLPGLAFRPLERCGMCSPEHGFSW